VNDESTLEPAAGGGDAANDDVGGDATEVLEEQPADEDSPDREGPAEEPTDETEEEEALEEARSGRRRSRSRGRRAGFAVLRGVAVLVAAAVVYQVLIPSTHVIRSRLARLVLAHTGVAAYNRTTPQSSEQDDTQTGLTVVSAAAKRSPNHTGLYSTEWSQSQTSGAGMIAFLLPSETEAASALAQVRNQQLAPSSYSSESLTRRSTYAVSGVPGSSGSTYTPTTKASGPTPTLAVTAFRYGRVVAVSEVLNSTGAQGDATTMARAELANLRRVEPGFSLTSIYRPPLATSLWAGGAVILALIAALAPVGWRRRSERRRRRLEEEMSHRVVVRGQVIVKHRR
jgi:hypothetical protein